MLSSKELYVIDAHGLLHRNYHALPKLATSKGEEAGALYGFVNWLLRFMREKKPKYIAVCFDSKGPTRRHEVYASYKANRPPTEDALISQLKTARDVVKAMGLKVFAQAGAEADDLMASIAAQVSKEGAEVVLVTSDKDIYQIVGGNVKMWSGSGKEAFKDGNTCMEKFGVPCARMADYLAIVGDSSDNVPGVAGLGPKAAAELISNFSGLDEILQAAAAGDDKIKPAVQKKLLDGRADALLSRRLVLLDTALTPGLKLEDLKPAPADKTELAQLVQRFEFKNLLSFLEEAPAPAAAPPVPVQGDLFAGFDSALQEDIPQARLADLLAAAHKYKEFFIYAEDDLFTFAFSGQDFAVLPLAQITQDERERLFELISDDKIQKLGHDVKAVLRALGFSPRPGQIINCFDTALAKYCIDPAGEFSLAGVLAVNLGFTLNHDDSPRRKMVLYVQNIWRLKEKFERILERGGRQKVYQHMEIPLMSVLLDLEQNGIMVDTAWLKTLGILFAKEMDNEQAAVNKIAGREVNVNSPKQLGVLLFEDLKLPPYKKTKTGYSTDEEALAHLTSVHPVAGHILKYRESAKLKSTYVDSLLNLADKDTRRVHTNFNQTGTVTGRLSSFSPNLQNIPIRSEKGRLIRQAFIAPEGKVLLSVDYSQIDLRVLAHESGDLNLINAFKENADIHTQTAAEVFNVMPAFVTPQMRSRAKAINFGIVYGQGPLALSESLNISVREAKEYIDAYFARYGVVKKWLDDTAAAARKAGFVKTLFGHVRYLPEFESGSARLASFANRASVNTIVQGGSSDIIKKAMEDIYAQMPQGVLMLLQVHDELVFEAPAGKIKETAAWVKEKMESAVSLKVPLLAEAKAGKNWNEMGKVP
ncbi:MAG: DNA polymerase I [Elusimicrobiota bacterium]|jgi:DNA polymerase-1|nr:DNA polymerase I [Elusimicrobiota bacterium]